MNRRQIQSVETHLRDAVQLCLAVPEGSVFPVFAGERTREHFIPRGETGEFRVNGHAQFLFVNRRAGSVGAAAHQRSQCFIERVPRERASRGAFAGAQFPCPGQKMLGVEGGGPLCRRLNQCRACLQLDGNVLPGLKFFLQVLSPRFEMVHPRLDGVKIISRFGHVKFAAPAVVDQQFHRRFTPGRVSFGAKFQDRRQTIMPVRKDIRFDHHALADYPFDGKTRRVNFRSDIFNDHAAAAAFGKCGIFIHRQKAFSDPATMLNWRCNRHGGNWIQMTRTNRGAVPDNAASGIFCGRFLCPRAQCVGAGGGPSATPRLDARIPRPTKRENR